MALGDEAEELIRMHHLVRQRVLLFASHAAPALIAGQHDVNIACAGSGIDMRVADVYARPVLINSEVVDPFVDGIVDLIVDSISNLPWCLRVGVAQARHCLGDDVNGGANCEHVRAGLVAQQKKPVALRSRK